MLQPDSLPIISVQLHLIHLSNEFGALCPNSAFEPHKTTTVNLLGIITVVALKITAVQWHWCTGCPPLLEGSEQFLGTFRTIVAQTLWTNELCCWQGQSAFAPGYLVLPVFLCQHWYFWSHTMNPARGWIQQGKPCFKVAQFLYEVGHPATHC